jgi:hypothetical protein
MTGRHRARRSDKCSRRGKTDLGEETKKNKGAVLPSYADGSERICAVRTRHGPLGTKLLRHPQGACKYPLAGVSGSARKALPLRCRSVANGIHQSCAAARSGSANKRAIRYGEQSPVSHHEPIAMHHLTGAHGAETWMRVSVPRACCRVESWRST